MPKIIPMSIAEIADRYTIAKLKSERCPECREEFAAQVDYLREGLDFTTPGLSGLVDDLYAANAEIWDAEWIIRVGQEQSMSWADIGKRAIAVRDYNRKRCKVKNAIIDLTGQGFKDMKVNYGG